MQNPTTCYDAGRLLGNHYRKEVRMRIFGKVTELIAGGMAVKEAARILGKQHVFSAGHRTSAPVYAPYHFRFCAEENERGRNWRLCFVTNQSLWQVRQKNPTEFATSSLWDMHPSWLDEVPQSGYRLLDFTLTPLEKVEERKVDLGVAGIKCSPAKVCTVAQAMIAMKVATTVQFLAYSYHWGEKLGELDKIPIIGVGGGDGLFVNTIPYFEPRHHVFQQSRLGDEENMPNIGVVLCIEPPVVYIRSKPSSK